MVYAEGDLNLDKTLIFDGFFSAHLDITIHAYVDDARKALHLSVTKNNNTWDHGSGAGTGFINIAALLWDPQPFDERYDIGETYFENWETVRDQQAYPGSNYQLRDKVVWGVYESDNSEHTYSGTLTPCTTYDIALSSSDFNDDGSLKDRTIIGDAIRRWQHYVPYKDTAQLFLQNSFTIPLSQVLTEPPTPKPPSTDNKTRQKAKYIEPGTMNVFKNIF